MISVENIKEALRKDYKYSFSFSQQGSVLSLSYAWGSKSGIIDRIDACVCGINPMTGKPLERSAYTFMFNAANQKVSRSLPLYGKYTLRFEAYTAGGDWIEDFCEPYEFTVYNKNNRPFIHYGISGVEMKWTKLTVESNCYPRLKGNLWIRCGGHLQKLPEMDSSMLCCYLPLNGESIQLMVLDSPADCPLPVPEKI